MQNITQILEIIGKSKDLIEEAYLNLKIPSTKENDPKYNHNVEKLFLNGLLKKSGSGEYTLDDKLRQFISSTQKLIRTYQRFPDIKKEYEELEDIWEDILDRIQNLNPYNDLINQFNIVCTQIYQEVHEALTKFNMLLDAEGGIVNNSESKTRQNRFYLDECKAMIEALNHISSKSQEWQEKFKEKEQLDNIYNLQQNYRIELSNSLLKWSQMFNEIANKLGKCITHYRKKHSPTISNIHRIMAAINENKFREFEPSEEQVDVMLAGNLGSLLTLEANKVNIRTVVIPNSYEKDLYNAAWQAKKEFNRETQINTTNLRHKAGPGVMKTPEEKKLLAEQLKAEQRQQNRYEQMKEKLLTQLKNSPKTVISLAEWVKQEVNDESKTKTVEVFITSFYGEYKMKHRTLSKFNINPKYKTESGSIFKKYSDIEVSYDQIS